MKKLLCLLLGLIPFYSYADTDPFVFNGRLQADSGWVMDDEAPQHHFTDGAVIRRLWLGFSGDFPEGWGYVIVPGWGGDTLRLQDAYLRYYTEDKYEIRIGQVRRFNGLESEASNNNLPFLERSGMTNAFRPRRNLALTFYPHGDGWGGSVGVFGRNFGGQPPGSENVSLDGRFFYYPLPNLHLGANLSVTDLQEEQERFAARGEATRPEESLVNTGLIPNLEGYTTSGLEAYYQDERLALMAEWQQQATDRRNAPEAAFHGGYMLATYSLTGETRPMDRRYGGFGGITPQETLTDGGIGAWEVALRRSYLDLSDADIRGGRLDSTALGLNWYPENNVKLMLNYIFHQNDAESRIPHADPQYLLLRTQLLF